MKRMAWMAIGAALLLGTTGASAQSLGDVARANRKAKVQQTSSKQYDNDNLPKTDHLSVVGPQSDSAANGQPSGDASNTPPATDAKPASDPKQEKIDRDRANSEWQGKLDDQKKKVDSLSHELDILQREYRLKAVEMYSDAGNRLRNAAEWDKEDRDYKQQIADKQKEVDSAKQALEDLQEEARKAGVPNNMRE